MQRKNQITTYNVNNLGNDERNMSTNSKIRKYI